MTDDELAQYFAQGSEGHGYEFKGSGPADTGSVLFAKVARAILGMANREDGGLVILGVGEEPNHAPRFDGLSSEELGTWNQDDVSAKLAPYTDPNVVVEVSTNTFAGRQFVVIRVHPFAEVPVICKKGFVGLTDKNPKTREILRRGAIYVRTRTKPETSEVPSQTEMRELMTLATERGIQSFLARTHRVGMELPLPDPKADARKFEAEMSEQFVAAYVNDPTDIAKRGHWFIRIYPSRYIGHRIPYRDLKPLLSRISVQLRAGSFPYIGSSLAYKHERTSIGYSMESAHLREIWRFFQSGQFISCDAIPEEWWVHGDLWVWVRRATSKLSE